MFLFDAFILRETNVKRILQITVDVLFPYISYSKFNEIIHFMNYF